MSDTINITPALMREIREDLTSLKRSVYELTQLVSDSGHLITSLSGRLRRLEDDIAAQIRLEIGGRFTFMENRLETRMNAFDARMDIRFETFEKRIDTRFDAFEARITTLIQGRAPNGGQSLPVQRDRP